ncbi:MAG TPA: alkaline phosphatase family protein [Candidatus Binataceae bacterium]|nr:alkaline phosphatase family protein [Candidatus Binataceae bacterium]
MSMRRLVSKSSRYLRAGMTFLALFNYTLAGPLLNAAQAANPDNVTRTPIKHTIIIIGENRTFDHIFATYLPKVPGETVSNLLSKKIIKADGTRGPNYSFGVQFSACDPGTGVNCQQAPTGFYETSPQGRSLYSVLPAPLAGGPTNVCKDNGICTLADATSSENGLAPEYYKFMLTGGTGLKSRTPDTRIPHVNKLPPGPFQLSSATFPYDSYAASPVHRFYQMWQQLDCNSDYAIFWNPAGCSADLFAWVEVTIGAGTNGLKQPANFSTEWSPTALTTGEGSTAMGFYNVQHGDAPYLKLLADTYSMSDNFHQSVMGGTGANHIMLGTGDAIFFSNAAGNPAIPPHKQLVFGGTANAGIVDEIENPNPQPKTNNWYTADGYGGGAFGSPSFGGGSYSNCSDIAQPGVAPVREYLASLPAKISPRCAPNSYYLLNNYNPGYFGDGTNAYTDHNVANTPFTIPPSNVHNIGNTLLAKGISWKYYGDQFNQYLSDKYQQDFGKVGQLSDQYCNICNPFQYSTSIMTNAAVRTAHLKDTTDFYSDIKNGTLPAVSFVKPSGWVDGHPASSKLILFEGFVKKIVDSVKANKTLWNSTAIFITFDEGGGYYDSGYVQPLDFFGDGTRIPLIVVSPFSTGGHISHTYGDHVSLLKWIEYNWELSPVTGRSRDNFPNPITAVGNPYVPLNTPAIGNLKDLFHF